MWLLLGGSHEDQIDNMQSDLPRSVILYTPAALELALRCPFFSSGGDDEKPEMAESTLVSSAVSADILTDSDWKMSSVLVIKWIGSS